MLTNAKYLYPVEKQNMLMREKINEILTVNRCEGVVAAYKYLSVKEHNKYFEGTLQVNVMIILCFIIYMGFLIL